MRRFLILLALLALATLAHAQQTNALTNVFYIAADGDCDNDACTSATRRMCRESGTATATYVCNTSTGFYVPLASGAPCTGSAVCDTEASIFTAVQVLQVNSASLDRQTALTIPGESSTLDVSSGFNHLQPTSVQVQSGCLTYDFALYPDDDYTPGEELLMYQGQVLNLNDGAPPMLRDDDLTGEVHAKFWNRGSMGCTFRLLLTGGGF